MKKTMTNYEISNIASYSDQPNSLFNKTDLHMSMTCVWRLRKNMKRISSLNELFEMERSNLMNSYNTPEKSFEKDGDRYVKEEYVDEYVAKMNDLLNQTNEIEIDTVTFDEITPDPDHLELSYEDMDILSFMIEDDEDKGIENAEDDIEVIEGEVIED